MRNNLNFEKLVNFLPSQKTNNSVNRLSFLLEGPKKTRIAVFGKYNHGKSTLLNSLVGHEHFKAADKRETVEVSELENNDVVWVDTPGLDADIHGKDDDLAKEAAFKVADFIFLVHNVKAGELDKYEEGLFNKLLRQDNNYKQKLFLILTQIDQLEKDDLDAVISSIHCQMPDLKILPVSATRYAKGVKESKDVYIKASGMLALTSLVDDLVSSSSLLKAKEIKRLKMKTIVELQEQLDMQEKELDSLSFKRKKREKEFVTSVSKLFEQTQYQVSNI
jgi:GTPase Era involved in 16S rRNA processing